MTKKKNYRIIAVVNTEFGGENPKNAFDNLQDQAETCSPEDWTLIYIEEIKENEP